MAMLSKLYGESLALLTDLYQLTMAYGYWKLGRAEQRATFHLTFRRHPFRGGYTIAAGLATALDYLRAFRFRDDDLAYLATLVGNDGRPLFERAFLDYLGRLQLAVDIDAIAEGTVVFPHEPLLRVTGPILQCQILETPLLNIVNFQSLIATKAARIFDAAGGEPILEFGLRRAQGIDGALAASRAAHIGGCQATSNVLAGKLLGIPVRGTHAHSWVMSFDDEREAFAGYARAMPNNCVFLVDTYDTLEGVKRAIEIGRSLRETGHRMVGLRLDSGDLAELSIKARELLDQAGFADAKIVASNDLDEHTIASLRQQGAQIAVWGVGTRLVTAYDQPALGGVYKLSALQDESGQWRHKIKLSQQAIKVSTPGWLQVRRLRDEKGYRADVIYDQLAPPSDDLKWVDLSDPAPQGTMDGTALTEDLLTPVVRGGQVSAETPPLEAIRRRTLEQLAAFGGGVRRLLNPHQYPVGLEEGLYELKTRMIREARETEPT